MPQQFETIDVKTLIDALQKRGISCVVTGPENTVSGFAPLTDCSAGHLVWSRASTVDVSQVAASVVILPQVAADLRPEPGDKTLIFVENPRDAFRILLADVFVAQVEAAKGLADPALFAADARGQGVRVADNVQMGKNVILHPNVVIYPNVVIGDNVEIGAGVTIGAPGYAYVRQPDGTLAHFPHVGGVVIGDDVTIGANSCVDGGGLGPTRIGRGTKIGNLCQIAHNVVVGEDCLLAGRVQIGGGTKVGDRAEIWPSVVVSNKLVLGAGCDIKLGSVVVQNVPDGASVSGNFAIPHDKSLREFAKRRR